MKSSFAVVLAVATAMLLSACQSKHQEGVTSNYRAQWTPVNADTQATTDAALAVLKEEGLKDVGGSSTNVDGEATAKKADGTKVRVSVEKQTATTSQVSVVVGTMGQPALGAEIARKIKERAEGGTGRTTGDRMEGGTRGTGTNTGTMTTPR